MPYLQLDLPENYSLETKQRLARRLGDLYCEIMQARAGIVHVAFRELGDGHLYRTGLTELMAAGFIMCDIRTGWPPEQRFALAQAIVEACGAELGTPEGAIPWSSRSTPTMRLCVMGSFLLSGALTSGGSVRRNIWN